MQSQRIPFLCIESCKVMPVKSKIEGSQYQEMIERELVQGTPYRKLSEILEEMGFPVSHSALSAYHKNKLGGFVGGSEAEQLEYSGTAIEFDPEKDDKEVLAESLRKQIQIVANKQQRFMNGECKFPTEELKALKVLHEMQKA